MRQKLKMALMGFLVGIALVNVGAQITVPHTFVAGDRALASQVNANFDTIESQALNRTGGTMTGQLTTQDVVPDGNNTRALGASGTRYSTLFGVNGNLSGALTVSGASSLAGLTASGATVLNNTVTVNNPGPHSVTGSSASVAGWYVRNTNNGSAAFARVSISADDPAQGLLLEHNSTTYTPSLDQPTSGSAIRATGSGGIAYTTTNGAATQRFITNGTLRMTIDAGGRVTMPSQPGFLAYRNADVSYGTGATIVFDTETYDTASNYNNTTGIFTAPITGTYELCTTVHYADNASSTWEVRIFTTGARYMVGSAGATTAGVTNGCVLASMAASDTAYVEITTGDIAVDILGLTSSIRRTWFTGRLVG